ncbi:hypothetical protein ACM26V_01900 [Salipaludibacillus sp. HK11]|uniref:hypothetical protein n=1 Tax=Salipaludibacillus sp. HK11 TaxID=3394320 RepID=UPI0039FD3030
MIVLVILSCFIVVICSVIFSRVFSEFLIKWKSESKFAKLNTDIQDIHYSFEELTYFVSLPNRNPVIYHSELSHFQAKPSYRSFIFPVHEGLITTLHRGNQDINIAFMSVDQFRIPLLERWRHERKINEKEYMEMKSYVLIHKLTRAAFIEEAYRQIRRDDRILFVEEPTEVF